MNFFQHIFDLADGVDLSIKIKRKNDKLTVSVLPGSSTSVTPLTVTATPEELDQGLDIIIVRPLLEVKALISNEAEFKKSIQERSAKTEPPVKGKSSGKKETRGTKKEKPVNEKKSAQSQKTTCATETETTEEEAGEQPITQPTFF